MYTWLHVCIQAVGEPPLFLAASSFYAIKDAITSARAESGLTGPFRLDSPATPERIRNACEDRFTKLVCSSFHCRLSIICVVWFILCTTVSLLNIIIKYVCLFQCPPAEPGTFTPWAVQV